MTHARPAHCMRRATPALLILAWALLAAPSAQADGPLRGNPVDSLPPMEKPAPPAPPPLQAPTPEQQAIAARLAQHIVPRHFDVAGAHVIPFEEISAILAPLANKDITLGQLVQQVDRITTLYRERGYPLSFAVVQNQTFAEGTVVVTVVEGHIGDMRIEGDIGHAEDRLRTLAQPMIDEKPLTQRTLERQLNLMRMVPGVTFTPALELPRRADGASELVLKATHKPVAVTAGVVDLGTGMQPLVNASANSLTPLGEQTRLTAAVPFGTDDVRYYAGDVTVPIGSSGLAVKVDGYHYEAKPQDDTVEMLGYKRTVKNDRIGIGVSYPFLLNNQSSLTGTLGMYAVNAQDIYDQHDTDLWLRQKTRVRAATAEMRYITVGPTRSTDVTLGVSKGMTGLGAQKTIDSNYGYTATPDVDLDFTRFNINAKQSFTLPAQFGLVLASAGQYSDNVLPSSEQVSFGSWRFGMGYPQGETSGDKGLGASIELNRKFPTGWQYLSAVQPYALVDYARTWYNAAALKPYNNRHLSSIALGVRFTDDKFYLFDFNVAKPVGSSTLNDDSRGWRFNANYQVFY